MYCDNYLKTRRDQMKICPHLFVVTKRGSKVGEEQSTHIIRCVYCDLTNEYLKDNPILLNEYQILHNIIFTNFILESEKSKKNIPFLSLDLFSSNHPGLLYRLAKDIKHDASKEELFKIMQRLREIETTEERRKKEFQESDENGIKKRYDKLMKKS